MSDHAASTEETHAPKGTDDQEANPAKPQKSAAEYAEDFGKAVDLAEKILRVAPLPMGAKRLAMRAMPTVKKAAKVAPIVAPVAEPYVRKAADQTKVIAPKVGNAAKAGAKTATAGVQSGAKAAASNAKAAASHVREAAPKAGHTIADGARAAASHVHDGAPKLGHAVADKASRVADKLKRKKDDR